MANKYLGETIDIHSGGQDLIFPHHENEIAQSECANCAQFSRYWMHNGYINIDGKKMSKSLGNFFTVRDILKEYDGETIRFFMLSAHYRSPINFADTLMEQSKSAVERVYTCIENLEFLKGAAAEGECDAELAEKLNGCRDKFRRAMDDDLNTADAIAAIFDIVYIANTEITSGSGKAATELALSLIRELGGVLGLFTKQKDNSLDAEVEALIEQRNAARKAKDWAAADAIRDKLKAMNIIIKDTRDGVKWTIQV